MTIVRSTRPAARAAMAAALVVAALSAPTAAVHAQSMATLRAAKNAAQNAAAATNAHTAAMTAPDGGSAAQRPSASSAPSAATVSKPAAAGAASKAGASSPRYAAGRGAPAAPATPASVAVSERGEATQITFSRETFEYGGRGRRDPFVSLMASGELRPLLSDLKLVTVLYDPTGRNSVAIMRDVSTKDQYRVKVGQTLGRMRVSQIQPKQVVFALEEFGYGRQEVLGLTDSTTARKQ